MNILLTADLHLDDNQLNEYRWNIFKVLEEEAVKNNVNLIGILGDTIDRKDHHSGKLVNKFKNFLVQLQKKTQADIVILSGNHDAPLKGEYFWDFLNDYSQISYITKPQEYVYSKECYRSIWFFPYSPNPINEWKSINFSRCDAIFMHQPVEGALIDEKRKLDKAPPIPVLPDVFIYSGDIHHQQTLTFNHKENSNDITYIGVPHPIHFNEIWKNRIILIKDDNFEHYQEIWIDGIKRAILELTDTSELASLNFKAGDQVRVRFSLTGENLTNWTFIEQKIRGWAKEKQVHLASVEASIIGEGVKATTDEAVQLEIMSPQEIIQKFCTDEKLSDEIKEVGLQILKGSI